MTRWRRRGRRSASANAPRAEATAPQPPVESNELPVEPPETAPASIAAAEDHVDELLRKMAGLRLAASAQLTVAAAAMEAGRPDIAADLIEAQQRDVDSLRATAKELVGEDSRQSVVFHSDLPGDEPPASLQPAALPWKRLPGPPDPAAPSGATKGAIPETSTVPLKAAAGVLAALAMTAVFAITAPFTPISSFSHDGGSSTSATASGGATGSDAPGVLSQRVVQSLSHLEAAAAARAPREDVEKAGHQLHAELHRLIPTAAKDPAAAKQLLLALSAERNLLVKYEPDALPALDSDQTVLVDSLRAVASPAVLALLPPVGQPVPALPVDPAPAPPVATQPTADPAPPQSPAPDQPAAPSTPPPATQPPDPSPPPTDGPPAVAPLSQDSVNPPAGVSGLTVNGG